MENIETYPRGGSKDTRLVLRQEVNFGCAVCGEPYLTYHHFDPTWAEKPHDNPEGMIALCAKHANAADGRAYSKERLHKFKKNPFLNNVSPKSHFEWARDNFLFIMGGNIAFNCNTLLKSKEEKVIWLEEDADLGLKTISLRLKDQQGNIFLSMERNQWTSNLSLVDDIESSYRGQRLKVILKDKKNSFEIKFTSVKLKELEIFLQKIIASSDTIRHTIDTANKEFQDEVAICTLTGQFYLPEKVILSEKKMVINKGMTIIGGYMGNCSIAIQIG